MNKLYCLVFVLFAYAPSAFADCALQELCWVVGDMNYTELGYYSEYIAYPAVWVKDNQQYVSFSIDTDDNIGDFLTIMNMNNEITNISYSTQMMFAM